MRKYTFHTKKGAVIMTVTKDETTFDLPQGLTGSEYQRFRERYRDKIREVKTGESIKAIV